MPIFDHFRLIAPYYDRLIQLREPEKLIDFANLPIQGKILDAGGGTGRVAQVLIDYATEVIVADLSFEMLRHASKKENLNRVLSHTESLPFGNEAFERVIMVDALHHVCNQVTTALELWRVLKTGGRLVIVEPDVRRFSVKLVALAEKVALMRSHFLSPPRIQNLFPDEISRSKIILNGFNAWVLIDKMGD